MLFFCMLCWESVYIFFLQTTVHLPRNNKNTWIICHVHYKGPMALINFKTSLVIYFFSCALTLYSYHFVDLKNVYFCWNNVTPTLVIITMLSSCSCINIRLIFCVQYIVTCNLFSQSFQMVLLMCPVAMSFEMAGSNSEENFVLTYL